MNHRRIKVLQLIGALNRGGAEQVVVSLCNHLDTEHFEVAIATLCESIPMAARLNRMQGVAVTTCGRLPGIPPFTNQLRSFLQLYKVVRQFNPDIIHSHLYSINAPLQWLCSLGVGSKHIVTIHSAGYHYSRPDHWPSKVFRWCEMINVHLSSASVVAVSNAVASIVSRNLHIGLDKIRTVYNGIDTEAISRAAFNHKTRQTLGFDHNDLLVVQVARFYEVKGHKHLLSAWPLVLAQVPEAKLLLVGDGPLWSDMQSLASDLGISQSVRFLGLRDDVPILLSGCDVGVFPSLFEGLPIAPIEMMSMGLPVVASDIAPLREVIGPEEGGILVPPGQPHELAIGILRLLKDSATRARMGDSARQRACRLFSINTQVEQHERLYTQLLGLQYED